MKITLYLSFKDGELKSREAAVGNALKEGFEKHGDTVEMIPTHEYVRPDWGSNLAVVIGLKGQSKAISEDYRLGGRPTMLVDKSYFGRTEYIRVSIGGFQPPYAHTQKRPHDRWNKIRDEFRIELQPKRNVKVGKYVIYAGSSQKYCDWHRLGNVSDYADSVCHQINKSIDIKSIRLLYRPKPSWVAGHQEDVRQVFNTDFSGPDVKLGALLPKCISLVTHGSNAAVEAIMAGVPALVLSDGMCAAHPVAEKDLERVLDPYFPSDDERLQWLADLAYCQFNMEELRNGTMWAICTPFTMKQLLLDLDKLPDDQAVIEQYKLMHQSYKQYRGGSLKGHTEVVADLVAKHKPQSLLDYGSGKGRQYFDLKLHERWGGLQPHCYDPGYPPIAKKPKGKFDGVICTDVAEHVPTDYVPAFLKEVIDYGNKFVFFCIYTGAARKFLPDGRNVHLTQMPKIWWLDRVAEACGGMIDHSSTFQIRKPQPGGAFEDFPHYVIRNTDGKEVVVTFRGEEE